MIEAARPPEGGRAAIHLVDDADRDAGIDQRLQLADIDAFRRVRARDVTDHGLDSVPPQAGTRPGMTKGEVASARPSRSRQQSHVLRVARRRALPRKEERRNRVELAEGAAACCEAAADNAVAMLGEVMADVRRP